MGFGTATPEVGSARCDTMLYFFCLNESDSIRLPFTCATLKSPTEYTLALIRLTPVTDTVADRRETTTVRSRTQEKSTVAVLLAAGSYAVLYYRDHISIEPVDAPCPHRSKE